MNSLYIVDWRQYGDFSAVGQLTKKVFSQLDENINLYQLKTSWSDSKISYLSIKQNKITPVVSWNIFPDAVLQEVVRNKDKKIFYVRLSPHVPTLELAIKLFSVNPDSHFIVHYMDKPDLSESSVSKKDYIEHMYRFLICKAKVFLTINSSSQSDLSQKFRKDPLVLGNFVSKRNQNLSEDMKRDFNQGKNIKTDKIKVKYFGSIDKKMNASAITEFAKCIQQYANIEFIIFTNSGLWGELKEIVHDSVNIVVRNSGLSERAYIEEMAQSNYLLLPYNNSSQSEKFLGHSFSNKLVDYIESGTEILAFGPKSIPTLNFCINTKLGQYFSNKDDINQFCSSLTSTPKNSISTKVSDELRAFIDNGNFNVLRFFELLNELFSETKSEHRLLGGNPANNVERQLRFLIKRKLFDHKTNKHSLSATLSSGILKRKGYKGFDYEV